MRGNNLASMRIGPKVIGLIVTAIVVLAAIGAVLGLLPSERQTPPPPPITRKEPSERSRMFGAMPSCRALVREHLKSPDSLASFSNFDYETTFDDATQTGYFRSYVDHQNAVGALVRSDFICTVKKRGDGWVATKVRLKARPRFP
jgi:hypothetical protein